MRSIGSISAEHLDDLKKSGLSDETIEKAGIKSIPPDMIRRELGFDNEKIKSCYRIPYDATFSRFKIFYRDSNGKNPKYIQRKGSSNKLYFPFFITQDILQDSNIDLLITEGEKKALKACQEGLFCIALPGLWGWSDGNKELIPDFDRINFVNRRVFIVPDSDWLLPNKHGYQKNLKLSVDTLSSRLIERGAKVFLVSLPSNNGEKCGLDDYLMNHTIEDFKALPTIEVKVTPPSATDILAEKIESADSEAVPGIIKELAEVKSEAKLYFYIEKLATRLKISKRAILKDIKAVREANATSRAYSASFSGLVDIAIDDNNCVVYIIKTSNGLSIEKDYIVGNGKVYPPDKQNLPFTLPRANEVLKWNDKEDHNLFGDIIQYFKRFSSLQDNQFQIIALSVFLTYLQDHSDIHYLPMLLFYAVPERGKTRTGKAFTYLAYRGTHLIDSRESNLFRYSQNLNATLFLDVKDLWRKVEKNGCEDILLLRYEKGATVSRVLYPEKGAFKDMVHFKVFGPTVIATNEAIHKILGTRCIPITMPNSPANYENPIPEKAQELKERLTAWRAKIMDTPLPTVEEIEELSGRLWDISKPLLQVCKLVYPQGFDDLQNTLVEIASQKAEDNKNTIEGQIVSALHELSADVEGGSVPEWTIKTQDVLDIVNRHRPDGYKMTSQALGKKLKAMGLGTEIVRGYSQIRMSISNYNLLLRQYGFSKNIIRIPSETLPLSTKLKE